jgi:hypothetical protein
MNIKIKFFTLIIILSIFTSCGNQKPSCITRQTETLQISWGERVSKTGFTRGYMMTTGAEIYSINKESENKDIVRKKIKNIEGSNFCSKLSLIQRVIMRNQALSIPADTVRFIEYENPSAKVFIFAEWNPKYTTVANLDFRMLYDSLQTLLKEK